MRKLLSRIAPAIALLAVLGAAQTAKADEVTVTGTSTGTVTGTAAAFLTFTGNAFTATTAGGVGAFSGNNRLGTFSLGTNGPTPGTPVSGTLTLNLFFTAPLGIAGGQGVVYTAALTGNVSTTGVGGVQVTWNDPDQTFTFASGNTTGSFTITLANLFIQSGQTSNLTAGLTGSQTAAPVPEPATMLLLGTGLAGVVGAARRRRKARQSD